MADRTITVKLSVPVLHGDEELTEFVMHEPNLGDLMKLDGASGGIEMTLLTICACTALPPSVVKQVKIHDLKPLAEAAATLMGESPATGARHRRGSPTSFTGNLAKLSA